MECATLPKLQSRVPRQRNRRTHGWHALRARAQHAPLGGASEADTEVRRLQCWRRPKPSRESSRRGARHDAHALRARRVQATARTERRGRVVSGGTHLPRMHIAPRALRRRIGVWRAAQLGEKLYWAATGHEANACEAACWVQRPRLQARRAPSCAARVQKRVCSVLRDAQRSCRVGALLPRTAAAHRCRAPLPPCLPVLLQLRSRRAATVVAPSSPATTALRRAFGTRSFSLAASSASIPALCLCRRPTSIA